MLFQSKAYGSRKAETLGTSRDDIFPLLMEGAGELIGVIWLMSRELLFKKPSGKKPNILTMGDQSNLLWYIHPPDP